MLPEFKNNFQKVSVVIPAYNKEHRFHNYLHILTRELEKLPYDYEVIIVNDGSNDKTLEKAIDYANGAQPDHFKIISYPLNVGKGFALCYGFTKTAGDPVVFFDADLDIHPRQIHLLLEYLVYHNADIVVGSRRHPDSITDYPLSRKIMSRGYHLLTRLLFGLNVKDTQLGLKVFRRHVLETVVPRLTIKQWTLDVEILVAARENGIKKVVEAPVILTHQDLGSTVKPRAIINFLKDTAAILYRQRLRQQYTSPSQENQKFSQVSRLT